MYGSSITYAVMRVTTPNEPTKQPFVNALPWLCVMQRNK
jgi:hypothetical protein